MLNGEVFYKLIETHFHSYLKNAHPSVKRVDARNLLTYTRFDLAFKLLYLEMQDKNVVFAKEAYREHIRAFSLGSFKEPGQEDKNSIEKYFQSFEDTFYDIKSNGFDASKSLVPLSRNGTIANGAHRVASAIFLDQEVECVQLDANDHLYDYKFFYSRNVKQELLDLAATKFVEYADNVYIAFVWPTAVGHDSPLEDVIPNIVYRKDVKLSPNGAHNLLSQIYYGEPWLGSVENNFSGSKGKLVECFKTFDPVGIIAFQAKSLDEVLQIKDRVRKLFNVGKHSIHITDTKKEAVRVARIMFNDNSIHFLNYAQPNKYRSTHAKLEKFRDFLVKNKINNEDIVLDSGIVLSLYGLREASDIDYLASDKFTIDYNDEELEYNDEELEYHDEELEYHDEEKAELIYNPKFYFYFNDIKFISFNQLYRMKRNRAEQKDIYDYRLMESIIENNRFKKIKSKVTQNIYYGKIKFRLKIIRLLKVVGLYEMAKKIYRGLKK